MRFLRTHPGEAVITDVIKCSSIKCVVTIKSARTFIKPFANAGFDVSRFLRLFILGERSLIVCGSLRRGTSTSSWCCIFKSSNT